MKKNYHILSIFPSILDSYFKESLLGKAADAGLIEIISHDLRNYTEDKHRRVDDSPFGGGAGMVMKAPVIDKAISEIKKIYPISRVILMSPRGAPLTQKKVKELSPENHLLFLAGRYEGIDERAIELCVDEEISIGDYILTGGELAAGVVIDALARLVPGVLGDETSSHDESFSEATLLEYPHYTRPAVYKGLEVPPVLLSGNHQEISKWREAQKKEVTAKRRPDLVRGLQKKSE